MDIDTENNLLHLLVKFLKSQIEDKKATITCFQLGDISSDVSAEFVKELIDDGIIEEEDGMSMIYLLALYSARLSKAIFKDEKVKSGD